MMIDTQVPLFAGLAFRQWRELQMRGLRQEVAALGVEDLLAPRSEEVAERIANRHRLEPARFNWPGATSMADSIEAPASSPMARELLGGRTVAAGSTVRVPRAIHRVPFVGDAASFRLRPTVASETVSGMVEERHVVVALAGRDIDAQWQRVRRALDLNAVRLASELSVWNDLVGVEVLNLIQLRRQHEQAERQRLNIPGVVPAVLPDTREPIERLLHRHGLGDALREH